MSSRGLRPGEAALWRRVASRVTPLPGKILDLEPPPTPGPPPPSPPRPLAIAPNSPPSSPPSPTRRRPGPPADLGAHKRVRRGRVDLAAKLDLHGLTQIDAEAVLTAFLRRAAAQGDRAVLVVTGKGMRRMGEEDPRPGVLRQRLPEWLAGAALRPIVSGYAPAHARHGGEGAYYVFLKRPEEP